MNKPLISIVVPVFNEEDNIGLLVKSIEEALSEVSFEILLVDDGSTDATIENILALKNPNIKLIEFSRNFGQTAAMAAGIEYANGEYIATIDGDLQNDPTDILKMLTKLQNEKLDLVVGIRAKRQDGFILRKIPSKIANFLIRKVLKVNITDIGCTLKVFKSKIAKKLDLYGELHRFIPIIASMYGAKIAEMPVKHHARQFGVSKYGIGRTFKVLSDLFTMTFLMKYRQKPMHLFGIIGFGLTGVGGLLVAYLLALKVMGMDIGNRPLFTISIFLLTAGIQLITTGFIAELIMRTYYATGSKKPYEIEKLHFKKD